MFRWMGGMPRPFLTVTVPLRELASLVGPDPDGTCRGEVLSDHLPGGHKADAMFDCLVGVVSCRHVPCPYKGGPPAAPFGSSACKYIHSSVVSVRRGPAIASPTPRSTPCATRIKGAIYIVGRVLEHRQYRYPLIAPVRAGLCSATLTGAPLRLPASLE